MPENVKEKLKTKINKIANEIDLSKQGRNKFSNYDYFTPDSILGALKPLLEKYQVFIYFNLNYNENSSNIATLNIENIEDETDKIIYTMASPDVEIKGANKIQQIGGAMTYCKRYLIMNAFHIADNKDDLDYNDKEPSEENKKESKETKKESKETKKEVTEPSELKIICEECGNEIKRTDKYSIEQILESSNKKYNKKLCVSCLRAANKQKEAEEAKKNGENN